jgi:hypothetical protein
MSSTDAPDGAPPITPLDHAQMVQSQHAEMVQSQHAAAIQQFRDAKGAAKTWGQTITGLLGLSGLVAIVKGDVQVKDLVWWGQVPTSVALLLAVGLAVFAIYEAMVAAYLAPNERDPALYMDKVMSMTKTAGESLECSIRAALTALALVALVAVGMLVCPKKPDEYMIRYSTGAIYCATMTTTKDGQVVYGTSPPGSDIAEMKKVDACPN